MLTQCTKMCFWKCTKMFFVNFQMCQNVIPMYKNVNPMFSKCTFLHIKIRGFKKQPKMCFDVHFCTFMLVYVHFCCWCYCFCCWCYCFFVVFVVNLLLRMYKMFKNVHFENIQVHLDNIFWKMHIRKHFLEKNNRRRNEADGSQQNVIEMCKENQVW